jgi:predicted nucleotidyltransferase
MDTEGLFRKFLSLTDALEAEKVDYVLIGGFAMVLHGMPRVTQDIDLFLKNREENIIRLQTALDKVFNNKNVYEISYDELKQYSVIRYGSDDGFFVDIITAIGTAFTYEDLKFEEIEIDGHKIKIASTETLYNLKKNTYREIDKNDILFLINMMKKGKE